MEAPLARRLERAFWSWQARTWDELLAPPETAARVDATVDRFTTLVPAGVVLDAACGTGAHMAALVNHTVVGVDFAPGMVRRAAAHGPVLQADLAQAWPIAPASVDGVLSVFTLQFFEPATFLGHIAACLKPTGHALVEWPRAVRAVRLPRSASVRLRIATAAKRASVAVGGRLGIARAYDPERVAAAANSVGLEVIDAVTLERSHFVVLRATGHP